MKHIYLSVLIGSLFVFTASLPVMASRIVLSDGTVINGEVTGMANGVYTIETSAMGTLNINADNVVSISKGNVANSSDNYGGNASAIDIIDGTNKKSTSKQDKLDSELKSNSYSSMQNEANQKVQSMMMNGDFLDSMMGLSENSKMTDVMNDPEVMDAINRGDYDFLMNNSKMQNLMDSSEIQTLLGDM